MSDRKSKIKDKHNVPINSFIWNKKHAYLYLFVEDTWDSFYTNICIIGKKETHDFIYTNKYEQVPGMKNMGWLYYPIGIIDGVDSVWIVNKSDKKYS